jgi:UDP-N-acetylglucosamine--N-acetylmuramyl-(pentapeptide) pyrophosphoryl-undecaprenol N-acetylglucosamine transferase
VFDFLEDMAGAYELADLLIGRCGAGTIFEAAHFGLPCVLIPYARGTKHQKDNAAYLKSKGAALFLDEETASCGDLKEILLKLLAEERMRQGLSQRIKMLDNPQAGRNLKEQVLACSRGRYARE